MAHIPKLIGNGDSEGSIGISFRNFSSIHDFDKAGSVVPSILYAFMNVFVFKRINRNKFNIMKATRLIKERSNLSFYQVKSFF